MFKWFLSFIFRVIFYDKLNEIKHLESKNKDLKKIYKTKKAQKYCFPKEHSVKRVRESVYLAKELGEMFEQTKKTHEESMKEIKTEIRSEYINLFTSVAQFVPHIAKQATRNFEQNNVQVDNDDIVIEVIDEDSNY